MDRLKKVLEDSSSVQVGDDEDFDEFEEELDESDYDEFDEEFDEDYEDEEEGEGEGEKGTIIEAESIEDGLVEASKKMSIPITELEYEIIQRGSHGFLGIGRRPYRFRIVPPAGYVSAAGEGVEGDLSAALASQAPPKPVSKDGFFKMRITKRGVLLKVVPPQGEGKPANFEEIQQAMTYKGLSNVPWEKVRGVIARNSSHYEVVMPYEGDIANDAQANVEISEDEMHAYMRVTPPRTGGRTFENEDVVRLLADRGVVEGILADEIERVLEEEIYNQPIEVARGSEPVPGENSRIEYKFKTNVEDINLVEDKETGKIDYHNLNLVENVVAGQILAVRVPSTKGQAGATVTGRSLPAPDGRDLELPVGKNVKVSDDGVQILSEINGQVVMAKGLISVEPIYEVGGDVGLATGNIVFLGTVLVRGSVQDGFSIKAAGNIDIRGSVGKAKLEAEGDIHLKQGLAGRDEAEIISGNNIYAKFIEHAKLVVAENDIIVSEGLIHSKARAGKRVICNGKRAMIVGGHILAGEEVNAKTIGSQSYTETLIEVGIDPKSREEYVSLEEERKELKDKLKEVSLNLNTLTDQKKSNKGSLPPEREEMLAGLTTQKEEMTSRLNEIEERFVELKSYLNALEEKGKIGVQKVVYPKVKVVVKDAVLEVRDEFTYVTFVQEAGNIKVLPYEEAKVKARPRGRGRK